MYILDLEESFQIVWCNLIYFFNLLVFGQFEYNFGSPWVNICFFFSFKILPKEHGGIRVIFRFIKDKIFGCKEAWISILVQLQESICLIEGECEETSDLVECTLHLGSFD